MDEGLSLLTKGWDVVITNCLSHPSLHDSHDSHCNDKKTKEKKNKAKFKVYISSLRGMIYKRVFRLQCPCRTSCNAKNCNRREMVYICAVLEKETGFLRTDYSARILSWISADVDSDSAPTAAARQTGHLLAPVVSHYSNKSMLTMLV